MYYKREHQPVGGSQQIVCLLLRFVYTLPLWNIVSMVWVHCTIVGYRQYGLHYRIEFCVEK